MQEIKPTRFRGEFLSADAVDEFHKSKSPIIDEMQTGFIIDTLKKLGKLSGGMLLDVGCGFGVATSLIAKHFDRAIGIDYSANQIRKAHEIVHSDHIQFQEGNAENLPVADNSVDVITSIFAVQYTDVNLFVQECRRVLKPQGVAVFYMDFLSALTATEHDNLPPIVDEIIEMKQNCLTNAEDSSHPDLHVIGGCQVLFDSIAWQKKDKILRKVEILTDLAVIRDFHLSIPSYAKIGTAKVDPTTLAFENIRKIWNTEATDDKEVKVRAAWDATLIVLKK